MFELKESKKIELLDVNAQIYKHSKFNTQHIHLDADNDEKVFIWPEQLKTFKDFNEVCVKGKKDKIKPEFIINNTYSGLKAKLLLTKIKNSYNV